MSTQPRTRSFGATAETVIIPVLLGLALVAWLLSARLGDAGMRVGILTGTNDMGGMDMGIHAMALPLFVATWIVMMVAMMFPAIVPVVMMVHRWAARKGVTRSITIPFASGYLLLWGAAGVGAYLVLVLLEGHFVQGSTLVRLGGVLVIVAGAYQFTPLKDSCLRQCRSPLSLLMTHAESLQRGVTSRIAVGMRHGAYCLGCCWGLMVVLIMIGMMNLIWMAVVAAVILAEKVMSSGRGASRIFGLGLVLFGGVVLISGAPLLA